MDKMLFKCSICGKEYDDLTLYMNCVNSCVEKEQKRDEFKRLVEEVQKASVAVKRSKEYLNYRIKELKDKYPEEYNKYYSTFVYVDEDNSYNDKCSCKEDCKSCEFDEDSNDRTCNKEDEEELKSFFVEIDSSNRNPKIKAVLNGKPVGEDVAIRLLESNPKVMDFAKTLGIFPEVKL